MLDSIFVLFRLGPTRLCHAGEGGSLHGRGRGRGSWRRPPTPSPSPEPLLIRQPGRTRRRSREEQKQESVSLGIKGGTTSGLTNKTYFLLTNYWFWVMGKIKTMCHWSNPSPQNQQRQMAAAASSQQKTNDLYYVGEFYG